MSRKFDLFDPQTKEKVTVEAEISGSGWKALCPKHDDTNPSLSIDEEKGVFHCFGCSWSGGIWDEEKASHREPGDEPDDDEPMVSEDDLRKLEIIAIYDYCDVTGKMVWQKVKYPKPPPENPKKWERFKSRQPDGKGGWIWNTKGIPPIPYRLPELLTGQNPIIITEGEKDADRVRSLGLTATTTGGASSWKHPGHTKWFGGVDAIIIPDMDKAGINGAYNEARYLKGTALSVRIVELPNNEDIWRGQIPEKADISDFLDRYPDMTKDDFLVMLDHLESLEEKEEPSHVIEFPSHVFQGFIKEFADAQSAQSEAPYEYWATLCGTYLGNIFCNRIKLRVSFAPEPRIFEINIGISGRQKKSTAQMLTDRFFRDYAKSRIIDPIVHTTFAASDAGLINALEEYRKVIFVADELFSLTQKAKIESSGLLPLINSLAERDYAENRTKKNPNKVEDVKLSMICNTTTDMWSTSFAPMFLDLGFLNRIWIVPSRKIKTVSWPEPLPDDIKEHLFEMLEERLDYWLEAPMDQVVTMSQEAWKIWDNWYRTRDQSTLASTRLDTYAMKWMQIFCISEHKTKIDADMINRVLELIEWQKQVRELYQPIFADNKLAEMEEKIRRAIPKIGDRVNIRMLQMSVHANRSGLKYWKDALENLKKNQEIEIKKEGKASWIERTGSFDMEEEVIEKEE